MHLPTISLPRYSASVFCDLGFVLPIFPFWNVRSFNSNVEGGNLKPPHDVCGAWQCSSHQAYKVVKVYPRFLSLSFSAITSLQQS